MNKACIAKMAWSLHTGASDLWCEVVWNKYKRNNSPRDIIAKPYDSSFWKAIAKVWPVLQDVELWSVGDGQKIRAWSMAWFDHEIKISETGIQIPIALQQAKVVDLVNEEGEWNHDLLDYWLLETIIRKIEAIPPPQMEAGEDCMLVELNDAGRMSVKSTYNHLDHYGAATEEKVWKRICRLKVPERVRYFIWLLCHNRLLTNASKSKMGLGSAMCNYCDNIVENALHAISDCPLAIAVWLQLVPDKARGHFYHGDLNNWIDVNLNSTGAKQFGIDWSIVWAITCHRLWFWRNKENHDENFSRPSMPTLYIRNQVKNYSDTDVLHIGDNTPIHTTILVGWKHPRVNWIKLNTDGSCRYDGIIGCGGVIRGSEGE
jgi:hypothetical protein